MNEQQQDLIKRLAERSQSGLAETVTWYAAQMPEHYYRSTIDAERIRHIEVLHAMRRMASAELTLIDDSEAGKLLVFGPPHVDTLTEALHLVGERFFHRIEIHATADRSLAIYAFVYGDEPPPDDYHAASHHADILAAACSGEDCIPRHLAQRYLSAVSEGYLARSSPERIARHLRAWAHAEDPEHLYVIDDEHREGRRRMARILLAGRMERHDYAHLLARFLGRNQLNLERGFMDLVPAASGDHLLLISTVYLSAADGGAIGVRRRERLTREMLGLKRHFDGQLGRLYDDALDLEQRHFEILAAATDFAAQLLPLSHSFLDVRETALRAIRVHRSLCREIAELVDHRFSSKAKSARWWQQRSDALRQRINASEEVDIALILQAMLDFVGAIRATNCYRPQRSGQCFQLDPSILPDEHFPHRAYGIFYFHGRYGMGFQVRFRACARGGLRLLQPRSREQLVRNRRRLLREVYDLAWAQQLKNKDIPEGGSKCIALIRPGGSADEMVKQLADSLLDVILPADLITEVRGPHGAERDQDLIFLGPDENMTPERIMWVAERARARGLPYHLTLMSSKPGSGINHKEYGVTSEGVFAWARHVLSALDISDEQSWTLSITGGPDGDVGGNLLRIAHREHGERCRVVAIADGSGCATDPDGLAWQQLLQLVDQGLPIAAFDPDALSSRGQVVSVTDRASEELRNTLHNRIQADIFIPCGGRPYTMDDRNWRDFLDEDGKPVARGMVEGANIFITAEARRQLQRAGLITIKDSSANKCGVITSSYEILAGLVTSEREFAQIKRRFVNEVIVKLHAAVEAEAEALFEAWRRRRQRAQLAELSLEFSGEINRITDVFEPLIRDSIDSSRYRDFWQAELEAHCPAVLVERFGDRLQGAVPLNHRIAIVTKRLASRMLYREGLTWCRNYITEDSADDVLGAYLDAQREVGQILTRIADCRMRPHLLEVLSDGTRRELVRRRLGR
ncbi:MAG: NAD-glutamate dehydrogenase domain-containing protein [Planctomycetota bacterium]|jgi:glutamate dehydrogenase